MPIVLYQLDGSPPCRAVLMVLELLGLDVELKVVSTITRDNFKPEYVEKNVLHTIPLLEDGDLTLADSHAIITYLVSKFGADKRAVLYPVALNTRAKVDEKLYFDAAILFSRFRSVMEYLMKDKKPGPSEAHVAQIEEAYGFLETYLTRSPFLAGDHITLADIACVATVSTLHSLVPIDDKFSKVHEWWDKIKQQDWYVKGNAPGLARFDGFIKLLKERNA